MRLTDREIEIQIQDLENIYVPNVKDGIEVRWDYKNVVGTMEFSVLKDGVIDFHEGDCVRLYLGANKKGLEDEPFFVGYVFTKTHNSTKQIKVLCYDQLRYLKNKDTYKIEGGKTYSQLLKDIIEERNLIGGEIDETEQEIPPKIHENKEYLEMLMEASDATTISSEQMYILYDRAGKICLKNINSLNKLDEIIEYNKMQDYDYTTSIDDGVYNRIRIIRPEGQESVAEDTDLIEKWGILQYTAKDNQTPNIDSVVDGVLKRVKKKQRTLSLKGLKGNTEYRAGNLVPVNMPGLGDINLVSYMLITRAVHKLGDGYHFTDLELLNEDFMPAVDLSGTFVWKDPKPVKSAGGGGTTNVTYAFKYGFSLLQEYVDKTPFKGTTSDIVEAAEKNGINPVLLTAIMMMETGRGTSNLFRNHNNPGGLRGSNGWMTFGTLKEGIESTARTVKNLTEQAISETGKTKATLTLDDLGGIYAPVYDNPQNANWGNMVQSFIDEIGANFGSIFEPESVVTVTDGAGDIGDIGEIDMSRYPNFYTDAVPQEVRDAVAAEPDIRRKKLILEATRYLGIPYQSPPYESINTPPEQLKNSDCSFFVRHVYYNTIGIDIGGYTVPQFLNHNNINTFRIISKDELKIGDIYFNGYAGGANGHVMMHAAPGWLVESGGCCGSKIAFRRHVRPWGTMAFRTDQIVRYLSDT